VRIVPNQYAEAGFTSLGPIFNLRMAFSVDNKDIVIDGMELLLRHQDGESRMLRWAGLGETFSEITDAAGNKQVVSRDQSPIAIKVGTQSLLEKFVRFQEPRYHEGDRPLTQALVAHFNYLKQTKPDAYVADALACKELFSLLEARRKAFWWKPGRYDIEVQLSSPQKFNLSSGRFRFDLTANDVQLLQRNFATLEAEVRNIISSNLPAGELELGERRCAPRGRRITPPSSGRATAGFACRVTPLMSNVRPRRAWLTMKSPSYRLQSGRFAPLAISTFCMVTFFP